MTKTTETVKAPDMTRKLELGDLAKITQISKDDSFFPNTSTLIGAEGRIIYLGKHWGGGWRAISLDSLSNGPFSSAHFFSARVALIKKGGK